MRQILFKAKRKDTGEWVEGCLIADELSNAAFIGYAFGTNNGILHDTDLVEVDPETVCQYTGLTDKNGKKIFEKDIMRYIYISTRGKERIKEYVVQWVDNGFHLFDDEYGFSPKDLEVIGNIHDEED